MLGYICKYAPVEIFESMGTEMKRIEPDVTNFNQAEIRMHPNICSFAKGVLEEVMSGEYEGIILTTCCDSIRRLYDVLKGEFPDKFIYMLDTPRITKEAGIRLYDQRIRDMIRGIREVFRKDIQREGILRLSEDETGRTAAFGKKRSFEYRDHRCPGQRQHQKDTGTAQRQCGV